MEEVIGIIVLFGCLIGLAAWRLLSSSKKWYAECSEVLDVIMKEPHFKEMVDDAGVDVQEFKVAFYIYEILASIERQLPESDRIDAGYHFQKVRLLVRNGVADKEVVFNMFRHAIKILESIDAGDDVSCRCQYFRLMKKSFAEALHCSEDKEIVTSTLDMLTLGRLSKFC